MEFLLTKLKGIFKFILPIKLTEKCQTTPFLPFERNFSMPTLAGSYKTVAEGMYRLFINPDSSHPFPWHSSKLGSHKSPKHALQKAVQMPTSPLHSVSSPFLLTRTIFPNLYGPDGTALPFIGLYAGFQTLTQRPHVTALLLLFTQSYSAVC